MSVLPSHDPDCCPPESGCLTDFISGEGGMYGLPFIVENNPFKVLRDGDPAPDGGCCNILCSGFPFIEDAKDTYLAYVSITGPNGGFIENVSGSSTFTTPVQNYTCCSALTDCPCVTTIPGGTTPSYCTTIISPSTVPTWVTCYCCSNSQTWTCSPFLWDPTGCKFTGKLYDSDGYNSTQFWTGEIYYDHCHAAWAVCTNWTGVSNAWPNGDCLYSQTEGSTGLGGGAWGTQYWQPGGTPLMPYGDFAEEVVTPPGYGNAHICYSRQTNACGAPYLPYQPCS